MINACNRQGLSNAEGNALLDSLGFLETPMYWDDYFADILNRTDNLRYYDEIPKSISPIKYLRTMAFMAERSGSGELVTRSIADKIAGDVYEETEFRIFWMMYPKDGKWVKTILDMQENMFLDRGLVTENVKGKLTLAPKFFGTRPWSEITWIRHCTVYSKEDRPDFVGRRAEFTYEDGEVQTYDWQKGWS